MPNLSNLLGYSRDFLQGMSNSAASNISAPVDGLAWMLRKGGMNIPPNPVGGSDWMAQQGLTQQPQIPLAGMLGETAGMLAPFGVAAKAPQIAGGLLRMGENAMVPTNLTGSSGGYASNPRAMNNQTGAVVWHGSPHKFDAFDSSKIGTGEGAQAYGHGLYLADSQDIAKGYRAKLNDPVIDSIKADRYDIAGDPMWAMKAFDKTGNLIPKAKGYLAPEDIAKHYGQEASDMVLATEYGGHFRNLGIQDGALYKVDLPDSHIAKMLDWDKGGEKTWKSAVKKFGSPQAASGALASKGVPGVRYLDGGSRGIGEGTSNYVVFPGNESMLNILERNGKAIK